MQGHYLEQTARSTAALDGRRIDRWFLGGSTPRAAARREFSEVEFHQVLSGKRDCFNPLR
jgi:hypothetical protein